MALYPGRAKTDPESRKYRLFGYRLAQNFAARSEHRMHFSIPSLSKVKTGLKPFSDLFYSSTGNGNYLTKKYFSAGIYEDIPLLKKEILIKRKSDLEPQQGIQEMAPAPFCLGKPWFISA
ncbi:MAG TPA: hypothetical protein H9694_01635 [Firmicutes bacterium]|nr:hypothetical protein [Bacillota bacterium]